MNDPDRIVCINLDARPDRWARFCQRTAKSKLLQQSGGITRFRALTPADVLRPRWWRDYEKKRSDGAYACRASHLAVWEQAIRDRVQHILIFEDDATLADDFDRSATQFYNELPHEWSGYYLGGQQKPQLEPFSQHCARLRSTYGMHAYGLSGKGLRRVHDFVTRFNRLPVDVALSKLCKSDSATHFFAVPRWLTWQESGRSDISHKYLPSEMFTRPRQGKRSCMWSGASESASTDKGNAVSPRKATRDTAHPPQMTATDAPPRRPPPNMIPTNATEKARQTLPSALHHKWSTNCAAKQIHQ